MCRLKSALSLTLIESISRVWEVQMQKVVAVLLISFLAAPAGAFAQDAPNNSGRDRDVGQTTSHNLSQDWLQKAVAREASQSADAFARAPLQRQSRLRRWAGRHPVLLGVLVLEGLVMVIALTSNRD